MRITNCIPPLGRLQLCWKDHVERRKSRTLFTVEKRSNRWTEIERDIRLAVRSQWPEDQTKKKQYMLRTARSNVNALYTAAITIIVYLLICVIWTSSRYCLIFVGCQKPQPRWSYNNDSWQPKPRGLIRAALNRSSRDA